MCERWKPEWGCSGGRQRGEWEEPGEHKEGVVWRRQARTLPAALAALTEPTCRASEALAG